MKLSLIFFLATLVASCYGDSSSPVAIQMLRPRSSLSGYKESGINCLSWRLAVETNNIIGQLVPQSCENYIGNYMMGKQYREDCNIVAATAYDYAKSLTLAGDGKDIWVFDIDETTLSNMPYYARSDVAFGSIAYNNTKFNLWVAEGTAPAVPGSVQLYKRLVSLGIKIVFLSGTLESFREVRTKNLQMVGYTTWEKLILKQDSDKSTAVEYKSRERKKLEESGYRIVGNMGDQWSDLIGTNVGNRTFKVPDPMYYIA